MARPGLPLLRPAGRGRPAGSSTYSRRRRRKLAVPVLLVPGSCCVTAEDHCGLMMCDQRCSSGDVDQITASKESEPEVEESRYAFDSELDHSGCEEEEEEEEEVVELVAPPQSCFSLSARSSSFTDRCSRVFDGLDSVDRTNISSLKEQKKKTDSVSALVTPPRRKTSAASPSCPTPLKKRGVPDYLLHPERWTHYSLEDVPESSDVENSTAALHFLSSLQQKETPESSCDIQERMIFSTLQQTPKEQPANQLSARTGNQGALHLGHLEEEEEKDEDGREREKAGERRTEQSEDVNISGGVDPVEEYKLAQKEKSVEESCPGFTPSRKPKGRNYRKSSRSQDD